MPAEWWLSLALAILAIAISPGNGALISMRYGLKAGVRYASPVIIGLQLGLLGIYGIVLCSLMVTNHISPHIINIIALIGGTYLMYLGSRDIWNVWKHSTPRSKLSAHIQNPAEYSAPESFLKRISTGILTNITNPKGILFMTAFFPQWLKVDAPWSLTQQALTMGGIAIIIDTTIMHGYAWFASSIRHLLTTPHIFRIIQSILGLLLFVIGLAMMLTRL